MARSDLRVSVLELQIPISWVPSWSPPRSAASCLSSLPHSLPPACQAGACVCVLLCSCCPLCLECPSPSPFLPLANATLSLTVMAWVTWAGCCSFFSSSMLPLLPLCPPTGPMVKLGYWFVSLPVPWSGCLGGSSMEHSAQPGTYQHPAQPRPTSSPCVLRSWI